MTAFGPFEHRPGIAVGVSGGPDSMALTLLLQDWVEARTGRLLALVVDHRLRADSTTEAAAVAARLRTLGIDVRVLTRDGPQLASAVQAKARAARYALLEEATAAAGLLHLAIAHHRQDQAETQALRRDAGSGERGLAGMAACRELDRVRLLRPLLDMAPERLKSLLLARGVPWLEDPANRDQRFWRGRFRAAKAGDRPATPPDAARRDELDRCIAAWLAAHARPHPLGFIIVPAPALAATPDELLRQLLAGLLVGVSGAVWPPGETELVRLGRWLRAGSGRRRALGGVLVERGAADTIRFVREPRAVAGPAVVPAGGLLWDGRFHVAALGHASAVSVAAAGPGWRSRLAARPATYGAPEPAAVPAIVLETLPLVAVDGALAALGPWRLAVAGDGLVVRFRPRQPPSCVPFGQTRRLSVVSPSESLMYGNA